MPAMLVILFVVVPLIEILVIIEVGQAIGAWWTIGILVADSILGAWLLRREGARAWRAFREALAQGRWPGDEVAQGSMIIVGGTLLLTPGFVTDVIGFLLLVPVSRRIASRTVRRRVRSGAAGAFGGVGGVGGGGGATNRSRRTTQGEGVLDVEVVEIRRDQGDDSSIRGSGSRDLGDGYPGDGGPDDPGPDDAGPDDPGPNGAGRGRG